MWKRFSRILSVSALLALGGIMSPMAFSAVVPGGPGGGGGGDGPECVADPQGVLCNAVQTDVCCHRRRDEMNGRYHCHRVMDDPQRKHCRLKTRRLQNFGPKR